MKATRGLRPASVAQGRDVPAGLDGVADLAHPGRQPVAQRVHIRDDHDQPPEPRRSRRSPRAPPPAPGSPDPDGESPGGSHSRVCRPLGLLPRLDGRRSRHPARPSPQRDAGIFERGRRPVEVRGRDDDLVDAERAVRVLNLRRRGVAGHAGRQPVDVTARRHVAQRPAGDPPPARVQPQLDAADDDHPVVVTVNPSARQALGRIGDLQRRQLRAPLRRRPPPSLDGQHELAAGWPVSLIRWASPISVQGKRLRHRQRELPAVDQGGSRRRGRARRWCRR